MNFFDFSFWQSFVSNGIATLIGAGLGVLGAHNYIAHLNKQKYPLFTVKGIKWDINSSSALMEYQLELNRFFDFMQFEEKRGLQWAEYDETHHLFGDDYQPDIDKFLDQIIQSSRIFNAIEKEPDYWKTIQSRLSKEQILTIIHYREKCGLRNP